MLSCVMAVCFLRRVESSFDYIDILIVGNLGEEKYAYADH